MAAITSGTAHRAEHVGGRIKPGLTTLREMLDALVSHRMRLAATEAEPFARGSPPARHRH
jgi:hypothetical protein